MLARAYQTTMPSHMTTRSGDLIRYTSRHAAGSDSNPTAFGCTVRCTLGCYRHYPADSIRSNPVRPPGLEPGIHRLKAGCSAIELRARGPSVRHASAVQT